MPFDSFYVSILSEKNKKRSFSLFLGAFNGGLSYLQSLMNINKSSSIVYIFKKYLSQLTPLPVKRHSIPAFCRYRFVFLNDYVSIAERSVNFSRHGRRAAG